MDMRGLIPVSAGLMGLVLLLASCGPGGAQRADDHVRKGRELIAAGQHEEAVAELSRAVALNKDSIDAHTLLGNAYRSLGQHEKAFEAYRAAKKIDRWVTAPHVENARALVAAGHIEAAIDQLNHVIELDPKHLEAMILLGRVSMLPRRLPEGGTGVPNASLQRAELNLEAAVRLSPDNLEANHQLAVAREALGKNAEARAAWSRVRDLGAGKPEHVQIVVESAAALRRLER